MVSDPYDRLENLLPEGDELGIPGYVSLGPIGEGGFARVFHARQSALMRDVAVKILAASAFNRQTVTRFERECQAIAALSGHPHIVEILDCGVNRWGRPYIVMDHMSGGSLSALIAESGALAWERALEILIKISGAVDTAHQAGILHRDIKPENILLSAYGEPKLADFGVASIPGGYQTRTGAITASLAHAAPEILDGGRPSRAVDVYALGSTLFTLIVGSAPFIDEESGLQALIARTLTQPVPDLRPRQIPDALCEVIERAMSKEPEARFGSAEEFARALQAIQSEVSLDVTEFPGEGATVVTYPEPTNALAEDITVSRERREVQLPRPLPPRRGRIAQHPAVLAAALLLSASSAAAFFLSRAEPPREGVAASAPTGSEDPLLGPADNQDNAIRSSSGTQNGPKKKRAEQKPKHANGRASRGGALAFAAPAVDRGSFTGGMNTSGGSNRTSTANSTVPRSDGDKRTSEAPAPEPEGADRVAELVLYYHWSDNGDYFYTTDRQTSLDKLGDYDYRKQLGRVWASGGSGMTALCFTADRCEGYVSRGEPDSGSSIPLYWHPGGSQGRFYSTDPTANYHGQPLNIYGWIRP
jgi:serine/threonine protein kinase